MVTNCSGNRVGTVDTSFSPVQPPEIKIWKVKFLVQKKKILAYCSGTALGTLTPTFHLFDLQKLKYRIKNFWTEKRKF